MTELETRLQTLQENLNAQADAELMDEVKKEVERFRRNVPIGPITFSAPSAESEQPELHRVTLNGGDLLSLLSDAMFAARRDTHRRRVVTEFIARVNDGRFERSVSEALNRGDGAYRP